MMESPPALALEDVSKKFGRIHAVDHLSLEVVCLASSRQLHAKWVKSFDKKLDLEKRT
jgi:hypothetical protein